MDRIIPISDLQTKAKKYIDQVRKTDEPIIVTQRGKAAAVLVSYECYEGFLAARDEMSFLDWKKRLAQAEKETRIGKGVTLEAYRRRRKLKP